MKFILNCIVDDTMLDNQNQETHRLNYTSNTLAAVYKSVSGTCGNVIPLDTCTKLVSIVDLNAIHLESVIMMLVKITFRNPYQLFTL